MTGAFARPIPWLLIFAVLAAPGYVAAESVFHVSEKGSDNNDGSSSAPLKSINKAIREAARSGGGQVRIAAGFYDEPVRLLDGVIVRGGYKTDFSAHEPLSKELLHSANGDPHAGLYSKHTRIKNSGKEPTVDFVTKGAATLENVIVVGPDLSKTPAGTSVALRLRPDTALTVTQTRIHAGIGGPGETGLAGPTRVGTCTDGGTGGISVAEFTRSKYATGGSYCKGYPGFPGGSVLRDTVVVAKGGDGGPEGLADCERDSREANYADRDKEIGKPGLPGERGPHGAGGLPNKDLEGVIRIDAQATVWTQASGTAGGRGFDGAGGGGGGAGGGMRVTWVFCQFETITGGQGMPGGPGGCSGEGGKPGGSGGAAFGALVENAKLIVRNTTFLRGNGGKGGDGGPGGVGTAGADRPPQNIGVVGPGGSSCWIGGTREAMAGGTGGRGGDGGPGGGGAGGNGGPSVGIAEVGKITVELHSYLFVGNGTAGSGGNGGKSGDATTGEPGRAGLALDRFHFKSVP